MVRDLERPGIACARMRTPQEFYDHPQLAARDRWREVGLARGPGARPAAAGRVEGREAAMGDVPALGQHSKALRQEFGDGSRT